MNCLLTFLCYRFVVILAKDLREDFYPHFQSFLDQLISLLRTQDPDQTEWTLVCLAFLFKVLKPFLKKDITVVFNAIMPLLDDRRNPEHVINFAAECFSFVVRDIKDKAKFLSLVLAALQRHKNGVKGCGRLLFEIMRGANGSLHSCTAEFLATLYDALRSSLYDQPLLFSVLSETVLQIVANTHPVGMAVFWDVSQRFVSDAIDGRSSALDTPMRSVLTLMGQAIEYRNGKLLGANADQMVSSLIRVVDSPTTSDETLTVTSQIVAVLLLSPNLCLTQLDASRITRKILAIPVASVFESFVWHVVKYAQFELLILPELLRYFELYSDEDRILELLCRVVLDKSPLSVDGIGLSGWQLYPLRPKTEQTRTALERRILQAERPNDALLMSLFVYCHLVGKEGGDVPEHIGKLTNVMCDQLSANNGSEVAAAAANQRDLFVLTQLVEAMIHMNATLQHERLIDALLPYCCDLKYASVALGCLDQIVTVLPDAVRTQAMFDRFRDGIGEQLSSHCSRVRRLTAHVLMTLSQPVIGKAFEIYEIFYNVESIVANVQTYRDQLLQISKLATDRELFAATLLNTKLAVDPLRYVYDWR